MGCCQWKVECLYVVSGNMDKIANVDSDECIITADGMLLKYGNDVILARTDEGNMMFFIYRNKKGKRNKIGKMHFFF